MTTLLPSELMPSAEAVDRLLVATPRHAVAMPLWMLDVRPVEACRGGNMLISQVKPLNPGRTEDLMVQVLAGLPLSQAQGIVASWRHANQACGSPDRDSVELCAALVGQRAAVEDERW